MFKFEITPQKWVFQILFANKQILKLKYFLNKVC